MKTVDKDGNRKLTDKQFAEVLAGLGKKFIA